MRDAIFNSEVGDGCMKSVELDSTPNANYQPSPIFQHPTCERAQSVSSTQQLAPHGMAISEHPLAEILLASTINIPQADTSLSPPTSSRTKSWIQIAAPLASAPINRTSSSQPPKLPSIFVHFPRHLDVADLIYLNSRDALTLPPEILQIVILKAYIEFVHPTFPILDLEGFLSVAKYGFKGLEGEKGKGVSRESADKKQIPFLLFQAVMFAGVEFVGLKALKDAGYKTREIAKKAFFGRVRVCPLMIHKMDVG